MTTNILSWKSSTRTLSEQIVGFGIIAIGSVSFFLLNRFLFAMGSGWFAAKHQAPWTLPSTWNMPVLACVHIAIAVSFWYLWRVHSMKHLKLELYLVLSCLFMETVWSTILYVLHEPLPALVALILWMSAGHILTALFWKREKLAGCFFFLSLVWIFYSLSTNIVLCITNP